MASGKELRRRITSIKSTQQITRAMKMVSAAKLRRAQDAITAARPYAIGVRKVVTQLTKDASLSEEHPLLELRDEKKSVLTVLFTSDRGLCGGFNSNLNKKALANAKEDAFKFEKFQFACVGKKGNEFLKLRGLDVYTHYEDFQKNADLAKISALGEELTQLYLDGDFDEVRIIFSEFKSALSQIPRQQALLPISTDALEDVGEGVGEDASKEFADFTFEPSKEGILASLLPHYIKISLYRALLESTASEHGARMAAMDSATSNAGDVIRKLTLQYNNVRQAGITKELLEITSGAEAL